MSSFKLWRDGIVMAALVLGGFFLTLSRLGFEANWELARWNQNAVAPGVLRVHFGHASRGSFSLLMDAAAPRKRDEVSLRTACRRYDVRYQRSFGDIAIDPPQVGSCFDDQPLLATFARAVRYKLHNGQMTLTTADGEVLVFRRLGLL